MPLIPVASPLITDMRAALPDAMMPPDALVVRGYPGPATDVLRYANRILGAYGINAAIDVPAHEAAGAPANAPWRIYLSARLDCWIEIDDWGASVLRADRETDTDRRDSWIVWLRRRNADGNQAHYRVVTTDWLGDDDGFLSGRLVEDYMTRGASNNVVWDEQQFGPTTGKLSTKHCF